MRPPHQQFRPEADLLLCTARTGIVPETATRIQALTREPINWEDLIELAYFHGVLPALYWNLRAHCLENIPDAALEQLRDDFYANAAKAVFLVAELCNILRVLERQGIPAVPFKGPVLAASVYGNTWLRHAGDLDILIRKEDALKARDALLQTEYVPRVSLSKDQIAAALKSNHVYGLVRKDGRASVELQWNITKTYLSSPIDTEGLWERLRLVHLDGTTVPNLGAEDLLLLLCVHGAKHRWLRLGWICDVAELVDRNELDWESLLDQASRAGGMRMLALGLLLARDFFGAELPAKAMKCIQADKSVKSLASKVRERFFREIQGPQDGADPTLGSSIYFNMRSRERLQDKLRCLSYLVTPHLKDQNLLALPRRLSFLHYAIRPIRLVAILSINQWKRIHPIKFR